MKQLPLAIVLGVDTPIGLAVVRELGKHLVPVHGIGRIPLAIGGASRYCKSFSVRPNNSSISEWLPGLIASAGAKAVFAISESDLIELAEFKSTLRALCDHIEARRPIRHCCKSHVIR